MQKFDIVLPLYHPADGWEEHILEAVTGIRSYFSGKDCEIHVYLTNDGYPVEYYSKDSLERINNALDGKLHFLTYTPNQGKGYSLRYLIERTEGDYIVYTDGDFPFGWKSVAEAFELLLSGAEVVMGKRGTDYSGALCFLRKVLSKGTRFLNKTLLGLPAEFLDTQAGLKGFNKKGKEFFLKTTVNTFVFDTEFILLAWKNSLNIKTLPIKIREGLLLSSMGFKVMLRELRLFLKILWNIRIRKRY